MSSFSMDTRSMSSSPLVDSLVKNRLFKTAPDIVEPPFQFIHTGFICGGHDATWLPRFRNTHWTPESLAFLDAAVQLLRVRGAVFRCTVLLEQIESLPDTLLIAGSSMTSLRRREAASKKSVSHCRFIQHFLWRSVCGCIFQGSAATNYK